MKGKTVEIILAVLILVMMSGYFMIRHEVYTKKDFVKTIDTTIEYVKQDEWTKAAESSQKVKSEWNRVKYILMVNDAEADIAIFEEYLNLFVQGTKNKDEKDSLSSAAVLKDTWSKLNKFVPGP